MSFDFPHTCPDIDASIKRARVSLRDSIDDLLKEACPLLSDTLREHYAKAHADAFYEAIEDSFEDVRKTNEQIRREAEKQVDALEDEIADLQSQVSELESRVES